MSKVDEQPDRYLRGENVALRARHPADVPVLHSQLYNDIVTRSRGGLRPWRPIPPDPALSPFAIGEAKDDTAPFSTVTADGSELAGEALLWGIDLQNRSAHLGVALLPAYRGRGWSTEVLHLLCRYGFALLGLNRLQLETLADNTPMCGAARRAGFQPEGVHRQMAWTVGSFADVAVFGLLAGEWSDASAT